jgi:Ca2+-binding RTX toxin-like protein
MAGVSEFETGGVRYGGSGGDVIAASEKMIFDWVKAPGYSYTLDFDTGYWSMPIRDEFEPYYEYTQSTYNYLGGATGIVAFDTFSPGQAFEALPSAFNFSSTDNWLINPLMVVDLTQSSPGNTGWAWNPVSGTLDPQASIDGSKLEGRWPWGDAWLSASSVVYGIGLDSDKSGSHGSWEMLKITERGHWALRETGDLTAFGGDGNDRIYGGTGSDRLFGEAGDDEIYGGLGPAHLSGGQGKDLLVAGSGQQVLDGGSGSDTLRDGAGETIMTGGTGADTFVFGQGSGGADKVLDLNIARDHIRIEGIAGLADAGAVVDRMMDLGGSTLIDLGQGHTVLLMGVDTEHLTARAESVFTFA